MKRAILSLLLFCLVVFSGAAAGQVGHVEEIAPCVFFRQGDLEHKGHCNNARIFFEDYVLVIDANFPSGAEEVLLEIKRTTSKPIRFVVDTHPHGNHAYDVFVNGPFNLLGVGNTGSWVQVLESAETLDFSLIVLSSKPSVRNSATSRSVHRKAAKFPLLRRRTG